jgi:NTE family protein
MDDAAKREDRPAPKGITLALQGGGAHGAFTWGVLDRLLDDEGIAIEAISGTSAGAMNGAALASGQALGGRHGARQALASFWEAIGGLNRLSPFPRLPWDQMFGRWNLDHNPGWIAFDLATRLFSPYQANPLGWNPVAEVLDATVDLAALAAPGAPALYVSATSARTGEIRVFTREEVTRDVLLASSCLPFLHQAVRIDGEPYWDGGYTGNPALFPLIYGAHPRDLVIVQVNPRRREEAPTTAAGILNRINEISFNASLMRELRAIAFVSRLIETENLDPARYPRVRVHMIEAEEEMQALSVSSKFNTDPAFLQHLREVGREAASRWLARNRAALGERSTLVLEGARP